MLKLHSLKPNKGAKTNTRRIGRGPGSGRGKTAGKGTKGQKARTGGRKGLKQKGMKMVIQRIPKLRGFKSHHAKPETVSLRALAERFPQGGMVTPTELAKRGLIRDAGAEVKIVGGGDRVEAKKWTVKGCAVSSGAKAAIEKAGGTVAGPKAAR